MAVYINGELVNGCTNYASAVSCVDKDGKPSTVQAEIDGLNESVSEQNKNLTASDNLQFRFATDGEGNYGYLKADDSFVPFKSGLKFKELKTVSMGTGTTTINLGYKPQFIVYVMKYGSNVYVHIANFFENMFAKYEGADCVWYTNSDLAPLRQLDNGFEFINGYGVGATWQFMIYA